MFVIFLHRNEEYSHPLSFTTVNPVLCGHSSETVNCKKIKGDTSQQRQLRLLLNLVKLKCEIEWLEWNVPNSTLCTASEFRSRYQSRHR